MVLFKKNNPGCQCCTETIECAGCTNVPSEVTVDIGGTVTDDYCSNCDQFPGEYVLAYLTGSAFICRWRYIDNDFDWGCPYNALQGPGGVGSCVPDTGIVLTLTYNGSAKQYTLQLDMGGCVLNRPLVKWTSGTSEDCGDSPVSMSYSSTAGDDDDNNCDWDSSNATVTL